MNRRAFLATPALALAQTAPPIPIIDCHIHLFDTNRPGGVPWPSKDNATLYKPALPARYRAIAEPLGVVGAIEVEASPLVEDNQWVLDLARDNPILVGTIGHLEPADPAFRKHLDRFTRNPLFRGIRYGNLWGRDLAGEMAKPDFIPNVRALADAGLVLDTANPNPALIAAVVRLTDRIPNLRVVLDHLPQMDPRSAAESLRELARRPLVYVKLSSVLRRVNGRVPEDLAFYRDRLDSLFDLFGQDRVVYGSDWPNCDNWAPYPVVLKIVRDYFRAKARRTAENYFWRNSVAAYRWVKRSPNQPV